MEAPMKQISVLVFFAILAISGLQTVYGAGECGKSSTPDREAFKLAPCMSAAQDETAPVSSSCCAQVKRIGQNPSCLCAAMLSNTAKMAGIKPGVAVTIPKRCNLSDRPTGYKCGGQFSLLSLTAEKFLIGNLSPDASSVGRYHGITQCPNGHDWSPPCCSLDRPVVLK